MENVYITALKESLKKKIEIMNEIVQKNKEQYDLIMSNPFSEDEFDKNSEEKGVLIYKLNKLDDGFQLTYDKVSEEIKCNRENYREEIKEMQQDIATITSLSARIQADEQRNKAALEGYFNNQRQKIKGQRSQSKAVKSYADAMRFTKKV